MKAALFVTCIVDQFFPQVGVSTVRLLRKLGVEVEFPAQQTCCGQPAFNTGYRSDARQVAERFIRIFEDSEYVVAPSGSCVSMVRVSYPDLFKEEEAWSRRAVALAARTFELTEFIVKVLHVEDVGAEYHGRVAYHPSCHLLRELNVNAEPLKLLRAVRGIELVDFERAEMCCGFGGTFAVKYPQISGGILNEKLDTLQRSGADVVVANDMGCLMHMGGGLSRQKVPIRTAHVAEILGG
jgi:L-lactate dehydrogenase complex protein LldE